MDKIQVFIVEDEFLHLEHTKVVVESCGYDIVGESGNADEALNEIKKANPNVVLMDIALPGKRNGISLAKELERNVAVIFTTSFKDEETLLEASEVDPSGYLVKPIDENNLKAMVTLAMAKRQNPSAESSTTEKDVMLIRSGNKLQKVCQKDIIYIESAGDHYSKIVTDKHQLVTRNTLKQLKGKLPDMFIQSHRAFLVNLEKVDFVHEKDQVISVGEFEVPLGRSYKDNFLSQFKRF